MFIVLSHLFNQTIDVITLLHTNEIGWSIDQQTNRPTDRNENANQNENTEHEKIN